MLNFLGFLALVCFFVHPAVAGLGASIYKDAEFYLISVFNFSIPQTVPRYNRVLGGKGKDGFTLHFPCARLLHLFLFFRFISFCFSDFYFIVPVAVTFYSDGGNREHAIDQSEHCRNYGVS